jgi:hypothetical protein
MLEKNGLSKIANYVQLSDSSTLCVFLSQPWNKLAVLNLKFKTAIISDKSILFQEFVKNLVYKIKKLFFSLISTQLASIDRISGILFICG